MATQQQIDQYIAKLADSDIDRLLGELKGRAVQAERYEDLAREVSEYRDRRAETLSMIPLIEAEIKRRVPR